MHLCKPRQPMYHPPGALIRQPGSHANEDSRILRPTLWTCDSYSKNPEDCDSTWSERGGWHVLVSGPCPGRYRNVMTVGVIMASKSRI